MNFLRGLLSRVSSDKSDNKVNSSNDLDVDLKKGIDFLKKFGCIASVFSGFGCIIIAIPIFVVLFVLGIFSGDGGDGLVVYPGECGFTISATSLSKSEYKKRIEEYASSHSQWKIFADNADKVYDYAVSKNVNPELVVTVAYKEGGGDETSGSYNYWGLN